MASSKMFGVNIFGDKKGKPSLLTLLKNCGWHNGFDSPFASKETKKYEQKLELKQRKIMLMRYDAEDIIQHVNSLRKHYFETNRDIDVTHALIRAKRQEVESETVFFGRATDIETSLQRNVTDLHSKLEEIRERKHRLCASIEKRKPIIEELLKTIHTDSELIKIYEKKRESCMLVTTDISKLESEDEVHVREIETRVIELSRTNKKLSSELEFRALTTVKFNDQYERLTREFRQMLKQRRDTIRIWESSLAVMKSRDNEMRQMAEDYYELRSIERELISDINAQNDLKQQVNESIAERHRQIMLFDHHKSQLHGCVNNARIRINALEIEKTQANVFIQQMCAQIRDKREYLDKTFAKLNTWTTKVQDLELIVEKVRIRYDEIKSMNLNREDCIRELDKIYEEHQAEIEAQEKQIHFNRTMKFSMEKQKHETQTEIRLIETKTLRLTKYFKDMLIKERRNAENCASLAGQMYKLDLEISAFEVKISHSMGSSENPNFLVLQTVLSKRNHEFDTISELERTVSKELDFLHLKRHQVKHEIEGLMKEKAYIESTHNDVIKNLDMLNKIYKDSIEGFRNLRIDHSLKLVDKSRVMKLMKRHRDKLFQISQHRETVAGAVKERQAEVKHHLFLLEKLRKQMKSANIKICVNTNDALKHAEKLKSKYESMLLLMSPSSDAVEEEQSFGYQVRKIAKERELLIGERIRWEARVEESLLELEGLQNVLKTTKASNEMFKQSLQPAKENSHESKTVKIHQNNVKKAMVLRHRLERAEEVLKAKRKMLSYQYGIMKQQVRSANKNAEEKVLSLSKLVSQIDHVKGKLHRWDKLINHTTMKSLSGKITSRTTSSIEKQIRIKAMGIKLTESVKKLKELMESGGILHETIVNYLSARNLYDDLISNGISKPISSKLMTWVGRVRQT